MTIETADQLRAFIEQAPWVFAKTMPQWPHEYTKRGQTPDEDFEAAVVFIRERGYRKRFKSSYYHYFDVDGWSYWTMGAPIPETIILNRARTDAYHTALRGGVYIDAPPADRFEHDGNVALVHDIVTAPLPPEYETCDVLYCDPPWEQGFEAFDERAGITGRTYPQLVAALAQIIAASRVPVVLTLGKNLLKHLPAPEQTLPGKLNGAPAQVALWNLRWPSDVAPTLDELAEQYERVGDFMCGYGRSGKTFVEHGRSYVLSDYNPACIGYIALNAAGWAHPRQGTLLE